MSNIEPNIFRTVEVSPQVVFRYLPSSKWKRLAIDVCCKVPLRRETVTRTALVPRMALWGTRKYPDLLSVSRRLEEMNGAQMGANASKTGPVQVVRFGIGFPSPSYLGEDKPSSLGFSDELAFLWDLVSGHYLEDGAYPSSRFRIEQEEHRRSILSLVNNRPRYAMVRLSEEISQGEESGLPPWGLLGDLDAMGSKDTWDNWISVLATCPISIYAIGEGAEEVGKTLEGMKLGFPAERVPSAAAEATGAPTLPLSENVIEAQDFLPGEQTILCMAFGTGITKNHPLLPAFIVYDGILGGFPHSKLFANVREKHSLAYFADSSIDTWRGLVVAVAGIMDRDLHRARDLIAAEVESMRRGEISDEELHSTKTGLIRRYRSESDSQASLVRRQLSQEIMGGPGTEEELVSRIQRVTLDDVVKVAETARLKAVYALRAKDDR